MSNVYPLSDYPVDRAQIAQYVDAVFRHADPGTLVMLRAFTDAKPWNVRSWQSVPVEGEVVEAAARFAQRCADATEKVTFAPPAATFKNARSAAEKNVANGVVLLVECDDKARDARIHLERVLGPATLVIKSGGQYWDSYSNKGEYLPKLHLYWRLQVPTRTPEEHKLLKEARRIAQELARSDATAVPVCHPIRWPGSWHRKNEPRLARIVDQTDSEIELESAVAKLSQDAANLGIGIRRAGSTAQAQADIADIAAALAVIPNDDLPWGEWNRLAMAVWRASGGSEEGREALHGWSEKSGKYEFAVTDERFDHFELSPPTWAGAQTLFNEASKADPAWVRPSRAREADEIFEAVEERPGEIGDISDISDISVRAWLERDIPPPDFLLGEVFSTTSRIMLTGPTGLGKTNICLAIAAAIAQGEGFLHWKGSGKPCRVLYVDGEMSLRLIQARLRDVVRRGGLPEGLFVLSNEDHEIPPLNTVEGQKWIDAVIDQLGGIDFLFLDNMQALLTGDMKGDPEAWQPVLRWGKGLTARAIGQCWEHHTGRDESHSYGDQTREWQMDTCILMQRVEAKADIAFQLVFTKARQRTPQNRADYEEVVVTLQGDRWEWGRLGRARRRLPRRQNAVLAALRQLLADNPVVSETMLREACIAGRSVSAAETRKARRDTFNLAYREAVEAKLVWVYGDGARVTLTPDEDSDGGFEPVEEEGA